MTEPRGRGATGEDAPTLHRQEEGLPSDDTLTVDGTSTTSFPGLDRPLSPALKRGTAVGRFVVLEHVASGGMGSLYRAYDPQLDRAVALKLMRSTKKGDGKRDTVAAENLLREAKVLARLAHPNVVPVFDAGSFDEQVFIAMEFVEGQTLRQWLRGNPPLDAVLDVFEGAGLGLGAAHAAGLVHRDFKPDNVLVGGDGRPRVVDFGIARPARGAAGQGPSGSATAVGTSADGTTPSGRSSGDLVIDDGLVPSGPSATPELAWPETTVGSVQGTPLYMSPEQCLGKDVDPRSDQFSFCVCLHEAVYGKLPFSGRSWRELRHRIQRAEVAPPPPGKTAPRWLRAILLRGLSRRPEDRYPSLADLITALRKGRAQKHRAVLLGGAAAAILLVAGGAAALSRAPATKPCSGGAARASAAWGEGKDSPQRRAVREAFAATKLPYAAESWRTVERGLDAYATAWARVHEEACMATRVRGEQSEELMDLRMRCLDQRLIALEAHVAVLARADAKVVERAVTATGSLPSLTECSDGAALRAPVRLPSDPQVRRQIEAAEGDVAKASALTYAGHFGDAAELSRRTEEAARVIGYGPLHAAALVVRAKTEQKTTRFTEAAATLKEALLVAERAHHDRLAVEALIELLGVTGDELERFDEATYWTSLAEAKLERAGLDRDLRALLLARSASVLFRAGSYEESLSRETEATRELEEVHGRDDPLLITPLTTMGAVHLSRREHAQGEAYLRRALGIVEKAFGASHPLVAAILNNLAVGVSEQGHDADAVALYDRAIAIAEATFGPDAPEVARPLSNSANCLRVLGRYDEAIARLERTRRIYEKVYPAEHPFQSDPYLGMGRVRLVQKRYDEAIALLERALLIRERYHAEPADVVRAQLAVAQAREAAGKPREEVKALVARMEKTCRTGDAARSNGCADVAEWLKARSEAAGAAGKP